VSGSTYQAPIEIESTQGKTLAIHWLLRASKKHPSRNMAFKLSYELMDVASNLLLKYGDSFICSQVSKTFKL